MRQPKLGVFGVVEAKGGTSKLGDTKDGKQMHDKWIRSRIQKAMKDNPTSDDTALLRTVKDGPLFAILFKTDLRGSSPYLAVQVQTYPGITRWGSLFE